MFKGLVLFIFTLGSLHAADPSNKTIENMIDHLHIKIAKKKLLVITTCHGIPKPNSGLTPQQCGTRMTLRKTVKYSQYLNKSNLCNTLRNSYIPQNANCSPICSNCLFQYLS
jgi:hypothetical protein